MFVFHTLFLYICNRLNFKTLKFMGYILTMLILALNMGILMIFSGCSFIRLFKKHCSGNEVLTESDKSTMLVLALTLCFSAIFTGLCLGSMFTEIVSL